MYDQHFINTAWDFLEDHTKDLGLLWNPLSKIFVNDIFSVLREIAKNDDTKIRKMLTNN